MIHLRPTNQTLFVMTIAFLMSSTTTDAAFWEKSTGTSSCEQVCQINKAQAVPILMNPGSGAVAKYTCAAQGFFLMEIGTVVTAPQAPKYRCQVFYELNFGGTITTYKKLQTDFQCLCD